MLRRVIFLCQQAFIVSMFCLVGSQVAWAAVTVQDMSIYTDETTGVTIFTANVQLKGRHYMPQVLAASSPVTQLGVLELKPAGLTEDELADPDNVSRYLFSEEAQEAEFIYRIGGILRDRDAVKAEVVFVSRRDAQEEITARETVELDLLAAKENTGSEEDFDDWIKGRFYAWPSIAGFGKPSTMLDIWSQTPPYQENLSHLSSYRESLWDWDDDGELNVGSLAMFGGQVAIRETLQTQLLEDMSERALPQEEDLIPVDAIPGVEVMGHPYSHMLEELQAHAQQPEISALANYVPVDRLMLMLREPGAMAHFLEEGNDWSNYFAPVLGDSFIDYDLLERYTARFGFTPAQLKALFTGHSVAEMALFVPDVFFLDGTDVTIIFRLKDTAAFPLKMVQALPSGLILPVPVTDGGSFYASTYDGLLIFSTNEDELKKTLDIALAQGKGSLGQSEEFQVMNFKLPMEANSHAYIYFSDPFIRRLTGPEVKIGQLRRSLARSEMQLITAAALLYRLDHGVDAPDIATLHKHHYLSNNIAQQGEYVLEQGARVVSKTWGTLDCLTTLTANPANFVTETEALSYEEYSYDYSRHWSEFFDPIAVRADLQADGGIALETFILPLIDNSFYMRLLEFLGKQPPQKTVTPVYDQAAVATLMINIPKMSEEWDEDLFYEFRGLRYTPLMQLFPFLGDTAVISVQDAAPIIQTAFPGLSSIDYSGRSLFGFRGEEILMIPIISAVFSRPVDIAIPVSDEALAKRVIRSFSGMPMDDFMVLDAAYNEQEEKLYLELSVAGFIRMEFVASIENGWLHISNHPWTPVTIQGTQELTPNHAAIVVRPSEIRQESLQLASLAQKSYRHAAYASASELYPWMQAYQVDAQAALAMQKRALGRGTPLPPDVSFTLEVPFDVKPYGNYYKQKIDTSRIKDEANANNFSKDVMLWFRFETGGLRTRLEVGGTQ